MRILQYVIIVLVWLIHIGLPLNVYPNSWSSFQQNGFCGIKDNNGNIIIHPKYTNIVYSDGYFIVTTNVGLKGLFTKDGEIRIHPDKYSVLRKYTDNSCNHFLVGDCFLGIIDSSGKTVLEPIYTSIATDNVSKADSCFYIVKYHGFEGITSSSGKILVKPDKFHKVSLCKNSNGEYEAKGIIYNEGVYTINLQHGTVLERNSYGEYVNQSLDLTSVLTGADADGIVEFNKTLAVNGKYYVKDNSGKLVVDSIYDEIGLVGNGSSYFFQVQCNEYLGLLDKTGKTIIFPDAEFISLAPMSYFVLARNKNDKAAIYDYDGQIIENPYCRYASLVSPRQKNLIAFAERHGCWGIKNSKGKILMEPSYDDFNVIKIGEVEYLVFFKNGLAGLADMNGNIIFNADYTGFQECTYNKKYLYLFNGDYKGVGTIEGDVVIPPDVYKKIEYNVWPGGFECMLGNIKYLFTLKGDFKSKTDMTAFFEADKKEDLASQEFSNKNYSKAIEYYTDVLNVKKTSPYVYFNRGAAYYNLGKYQNAIKDFELCLANHPSKSLLYKSLDLIDQSKYYQIEKEKRNTRIVQAIVGLTIGTIAGCFMAHEKNSAKTPLHKANANNDAEEFGNLSEDHESDSEVKTMRKESVCGFCGGKGNTVEYTPNFGIDKEPYCDECGKNVVSGHYHKTCIHCNGTGKR